MVEEKTNYVFRVLDKGAPEFALVVSAWRISYWESKCCPDVDYATFLQFHNESMRRLLARSDTYVVEYEGIPETLGFAVAEHHPLHGPVLHYVYVKRPYRKQHLAKKLCIVAGVVPAASYSFRTKVGKVMAESLGLKFNPYLAYF